MSLWCNHIPTVVHSLIPLLSDYHQTPRDIEFSSRTINRRTLTVSAANHNSSLLQTLTSSQKEQVSLYVDAFLEWNQRMNLTAVTEKNEVMTRHVEDSLAIIPCIQNSYISHCSSSYKNLKLVDVGSGAGLPGLILAIACPGWKVTLLESMSKRCLFLEQAISVTGVTNVEVLRRRAEVFRHQVLKSLILS